MRSHLPWVPPAPRQEGGTRDTVLGGYSPSTQNKYCTVDSYQLVKGRVGARSATPRRTTLSLIISPSLPTGLINCNLFRMPPSGDEEESSSRGRLGLQRLLLVRPSGIEKTALPLFACSFMVFTPSSPFLCLQRVLFDGGFHRRSGASSRSPSPSVKANLLKNLPPLRTATAEEVASGASCRFCFEGVSEEGNAGQLIAPCLCTGSQEFVHVSCLRKWQRASQMAGRRTGHETFCTVCKAPFALPPPPLPKSPVHAGVLLVASPQLGGTFARSVILLCEVTPDGAHGVIINRPVRPEENGPKQAVERAAIVRGSGALALEWRRGGPVCGGRLGVVNYACLHTVHQPHRGRGLVRSLAVVTPLTAAVTEGAAARGELEDGEAGGDGRGGESEAGAGERRGLRSEEGSDTVETGLEESGESGDDEDEDGESEGEEGEDGEADEQNSPRRISEGTNPRASPDGTSHQNVDATASFSIDAPVAIHVATSSGSPRSMSTKAAASTVRRLAQVAVTSGQTMVGSTQMARTMLFIGYCRWGRNQLAGEIQRGSWELCKATPEDVLRGDPDLWDELRGSERIISLNEPPPDEEEEDRIDGL